jgi:signal transduction histidine kinase
MIRVLDHGPGLPPERLEAVFAPFVRGDDSRSSETGGAGLGLSIAQSIVQGLGGTISLANGQPTGLVASIRLPLIAKS